MEYYKVTIPIHESEIESEVLVALLSNIGFDSFEEKPSQLLAYAPAKDFDKNELLKIPFLDGINSKELLTIELMPDVNWNEVWESNYESVLIDEKCYIRAQFHPSMPNIQYEIVIRPKMAFGTAHHETTAMMIKTMMQSEFDVKVVLDMGCGSGILAILASMLGAKSITAVDIDNWSTENTTENSEINNIKNIEVLLGGSDVIKQNEYYDFILANINKNILIQDMKTYSDSLVVGGNILFSGFYNSDLNDIINTANECGFEFISNIENNNWVAALFVKNQKQN